MTKRYKILGDNLIPYEVDGLALYFVKQYYSGLEKHYQNSEVLIEQFVGDKGSLLRRRTGQK